ncbi:uncharacterized protein, partial [Temnothorax longispinosus]|uniref:uncharacterized protein n=1 Tax=Temnothorax longispinosus TaxID=300112 RepID=UPI003A998AD5
WMWPRWVRRFLSIEVQMEDLWVRISIPRDCLRMDYYIPGFINIDHWRWVQEERRIDRKLQNFTIALFDDGLQLVPSSWLFDNKTMCHWPPYTNEKKIRKAIMEEASPNCTWTAHKILRVFGTSGTYASRIEKVKLAQEYSDLDISDIDISHQKRIPRQKKTSSTSDDSDQNNNSISENEQVTKEKSLPVPPSLPKSFIVNKPTKEKMQSEEFYLNSKKKYCKRSLSHSRQRQRLV